MSIFLLLTTNLNLPSTLRGQCSGVQVTAGRVSEAKPSLCGRRKYHHTLFLLTTFFYSCLLLSHIWSLFICVLIISQKTGLSSHQSGSWSYVHSNKTCLPWRSRAELSKEKENINFIFLFLRQVL